MSRSLRFMALCLTMATFLACAGAREVPSRERIVLLLLKSTGAAFWRELEDGAKSVASQTQGVALEVRAGRDESDLLAQQQYLDEYFARLVEGRARPALSALVLTPSASGTELVGILAKYRRAGVPVILVDTRIDSGALASVNTDYSAYVGSSNSEGGRLAANAVHRALPTGGRILILNGVDGQESAKQRRAGFGAVIDSLAATGWKARVTERSANWQRAAAQTFVDGQLELGRSFDAIFAANDEMALGALEAYRQHPRVARPRAIVGFDATDEARAAVDSGYLFATIAQDARGMGSVAMRIALSDSAPLLVRRDSVVPVRLVTGSLK